MKTIFGLFDESKTGCIDREECRKLVQKSYVSIGYSKRPTDDEAYIIFDQIDSDRSGKVSIDEFYMFMLGIMQRLYVMPLREYLINEGFNLS